MIRFKIMIFFLFGSAFLLVYSLAWSSDLIEPTRFWSGTGLNVGKLSVFSEPQGLKVTLDGKKIGKTPFPFNKAKNLEGSIFGFILAFLGANLFVDPTRAVISAIAGMFIESLPTPINDNLIIPLARGIILTLTLI